MMFAMSWVSIERRRARGPGGDGDVPDPARDGLPHMTSAMPEDAAIGMRYLEEALKPDPNYAAGDHHARHVARRNGVRDGLGHRPPVYFTPYGGTPARFLWNPIGLILCQLPLVLVVAWD
jgi:hypothetical protein